MAVDLDELLRPSASALVLMEVTRGTVGDLAGDSPLANAARSRGHARHLVSLAHAARSVGVLVVHCTARFRADGVGSMANAPVLHLAMKREDRVGADSEGSDPIQELGPEPEDYVSSRLHGVGGFVGTELDPVLRSVGIKTVIIGGNSTNVGIMALVCEAVDFGYKVVVPSDGVVGVPIEYGDAVLEHSLKLLSKVMKTEEILALWRRSL